MSPTTPFPGIPAPNAIDTEIALYIQRFQAAMYRADDARLRIHDKTLDPTGSVGALHYVDGQLLRMIATLEEARFDITAIITIVEKACEESDPFLPVEVDAAMVTPDGSGRNQGGAP